MADGVTGFLVDDVDGAVQAVERAVGLDRATIAEQARRFGADRIVADYLAIYESILDSLC